MARTPYVLIIQSLRRLGLVVVDFRGPTSVQVFDAYPWILAIGVLIAFIWLGLQPALRENRTTSRIDAALIAVLAGLLGARAGYVATHWAYFSERTEETLFFWEGGLSWASGAVLALVGLAIYSRVKSRSFWQFADTLAVPAAIVASAAWLGCMVDRCAYGMKTASTLFTPPSSDMLGNIAPRWPTQALGGLLSLILVGALYGLSQLDLRPGLRAAISISAIALIALVLTFTRGDPMPAIAGIRWDGISSAAILSFGLILLATNLGK